MRRGDRGEKARRGEREREERKREEERERRESEKRRERGEKEIYSYKYRWIDTCRLEKKRREVHTGKDTRKKDRYNIGVCTTPIRGRRERERYKYIHRDRYIYMYMCIQRG